MLLIGQTFSGPINLATGDAVAIYDAVKLISDASGYKREIEWDRTKPDGQKLRAYDVSKLKALGFLPRYSLEKALAETFNWFSNHSNTIRR